MIIIINTFKKIGKKRVVVAGDGDDKNCGKWKNKKWWIVGGVKLWM